MTPKIIRMMLTEARRGDGSPDNPRRTVAELYTMNGILIAEYDPVRLADSRIHEEGLRKLGFKPSRSTQEAPI